MVDTKTLVVGAVAVLGGLVVAGRLSMDSLTNATSGGSGTVTNPDVPLDSQTGGVPEPDSPLGTAGTLEPDYGGINGIVSPDNWSSTREAVTAELYDTDTGE